MALKRIHLGLTAEQVRDVQKLGKKWGLNTTNTIRHCIALCASAEPEMKHVATAKESKQ